MRALFTNKGFILIWVLVMALIGLSSPLGTFAKQLRDAKMDVEFSQWLATLNQISPKIIDAVFQYVKVPPKIKFPGGSLELESNIAFVVIGFLFIVIGLVIHRRAVRSEAAFDDFIALLVLYLFLQIGTGIWVKQKIMPVPLQAGFLAIGMTLLVIFFTLRGGGIDDSRIFFRSTLQVYLIWLFLFPAETLGLTLTSLDRLASLGKDVKLPPVLGFWAVIGLVIAIPMIYAIGIKPASKPAAPAAKPAGGGSPAAAPKKAEGGGGGGLLGTLFKK